MWLCVVKDVTTNSEIQHPSTTPPSGKGSVDISANISGGWSGDGTARAMAGLRGRETGAEIRYMDGNLIRDRNMWETNGIYQGQEKLQVKEMEIDSDEAYYNNH